MRENRLWCRDKFEAVASSRALVACFDAWPHADPKSLIEPMSALLRTSILLLTLLDRTSSTGYCNDKSISCAAWAKDGECAGEFALNSTLVL